MTQKKNTASINSYLPILPERTFVSAEDALKKAARCSDANDSRRDACNFSFLEFSGITFKGEDLSGCEAHYSKFSDCEFIGCSISCTEFFYAVFENCRFVNCKMERGNFSFAFLDNVSFTSCNLDRTVFRFARGGFSCQSCMMERSSAPMSHLKVTLTDTDAPLFEANAAEVELEVLRSRLSGSEFNDSTVKGTVSESDLTRSEFNRADVSELKINVCAQSDMEIEDTVGWDEMEDDDLEDFFRSDDGDEK